MSAKSHYRIEFFMAAPVNEWHKLIPFDYMQKSFAEGAWTMLRAMQNHRTEHRLLKDGIVIDTMSRQTLNIN